MPALLPILAGLVLQGAIAGVPASPDEPSGPGSLQRVGTRFDFEESSRQRLEMPLGFTRTTPLGLDRFTSFGSMGPDDSVYHSGTFSLRFDVDGHSMAARTNVGRIPIRTDTEYEVAGWVRTDRLVQSEVTIAAWLVDEEGQPVPGTVVESRPVEQEGVWTRLAVDVSGLDRNARDLVLECRVIQPGDRSGHQPEPTPDIAGRAWFDDLMVTQLPTVRIDDATDTGIHRRPGTPMLHLRIDDPATEPIEWSLRIENERGATIDHIHGTMGDQPLDTWIEPLLPDNGWYRAVLTARTLGATTVIRSDRTDFVVLPEHTATARATTIGIEFTDPPTDRELELVEALGVGMVSVPALLDDGSGLLEDAGHRRRMGRLLDRGGTITCRFDRLPRTWATRHALDPDQFAEFIMLDEATWGPVLDRSIIPFGDAVAHWTLAGDTTAYVPAAQRLQERLSRLAPQATVLPPDDAPATEPFELLERWRDGVSCRILPPWNTDERGRLQPTPTFARLHSLLHHLSDRRFGGVIPLGARGHAWYLEPVESRAGGLLVPPDVTATVSAALGSDPIVVHDDAGNRRTLPLRDGTHDVDIDAARIQFLEGVDDAWIRFQRDLVIDPPTLIARPMRHRHQLRITNPWNETMEGVLVFEHADRAQVSPARIRLTMAPGETRRIPVDLIVTGPLPPGPMSMSGVLDRTGPDPMRMPVHCRVDVGLPSIDLSFREWNTPDGLRVELRATNHGDRPRAIEAALAGNGLPTAGTRRFDLAAGATITHWFDLHATADQLDDGPLRILVSELDATGRISHAIRWPREDADRLTGVHVDP
ncbi:MAG: hypothetical protein CMJ41_07225 [Phycisphaerae bacterium]|nr:hypothetical protein [Phycisphaerae bacterium]